MEIADLPLEIQDKIISHLDAVSLAKSRQVCRSWRNLHDQAKYRVLWQRACLRDISQDTLLELLGCDRGFFAALVKRESSIYRCANDVYNTYPVGGVVGGASSTEQLSDGQVDWAEVYKKWYRSRKVSDWPHSVVSLHGSSAGSIFDAKLSGDWVVCGEEDGTVTVLDTQTDMCLKKLKGHLRPVVTIALRVKPGTVYQDTFQPHDLIVSGSVDTTVRVWNIETGECLTTLRGHLNTVKCVAVQDNTAVSCAHDGRVNIWDIVKGTSVHSLNSVGDCFDTVSLWGDKVLASTASGILHLWSSKTGEYLVKLAFPSTERCVLAGSVLRGDLVMALSSDGRLGVWELRCCNTDSSIDTFTEYIFSTLGPSTNDVSTRVCLALRGSLVAMAVRTGTVYLYHVDGAWEKQFRQVKAVVHTEVRDHQLNAVAIGDNGNGPCLLTASGDGLIRIHRWFPPSSVDVRN